MRFVAWEYLLRFGHTYIGLSLLATGNDCDSWVGSEMSVVAGYEFEMEG